MHVTGVRGPAVALGCAPGCTGTEAFLICHKSSNFWRKCRLNKTYPPTRNKISGKVNSSVWNVDFFT